jgi:RsiW-degrading membrane proteinase PrsW (M82 family)
MSQLDRPSAAGAVDGRRRYWWRILLLCFGSYILGIAILIFTGNPNIFPTVIMLGSFMIPVAYVAFFFERRSIHGANIVATAQTFLYGGILGTFSAALLEPLFISNLDFGTAFIVGFIEEFCKIIGVLVIARRRRHDSEMDGLVFGAAAGMGFAAFESVGYAFTAFLRTSGSLSAAVEVTMFRGILSPIGHGTWTAILAGVLFRESQATRFRMDLRVLLAYLAAVALHGLWDGVPGLLANVVSNGFEIFIAQLLVGAAGILILWRLWRGAEKRQSSQELPAANPLVDRVEEGGT